VDIAEHKQPVTRDFWQSLFAADSIALIGASSVVNSWGFNVMRQLLSSTKELPDRHVYPINPSASEILGTKAYGSILDVPNTVELAVIAVRATKVPEILGECLQKGVKAALIISGGFAETGEVGAELESKIVEIARQGSLRFIGPNCIGHANIHAKLGTAAMTDRLKPGTVALLAQSGNLGARITQMAASRGIGFSKFVSTGNEASLHLEDYLEYLADDVDTSVITAYIEGLREGRRFFQLAKEITTKKPIVVIKAGGTREAKRAAISHTGALTGSNEVYKAAFRQTGVIETNDEDELCDVVAALLNQPLPPGDRIGILTMGGGLGVMATEACEREGLKIASLEQESLEKLDTVLPSRWSHGNPVDMAGIRPLANDTTILSCLKTLIEDKNVDVILSLVSPGVSIRYIAETLNDEEILALKARNEEDMDMLSEWAYEHRKPLFLVALIPQIDSEQAATPVGQRRIPEYPNPRRAARVIRHLFWYKQYIDGN